MRSETSPPAVPLYRQLVHMSAEDGDPRGRLFPRVLLELLQQAAGRDASERGAGMERLMEQGLAWMLVRLIVEIARWPVPADVCFLSTWATSFGGATAEREFALERREPGMASGADEAESGPRIVEATSRWAVVDLAARRAVRLPAFVRSLPVSPARGSARFPPAPERPAGAPLLGECEVRVDAADLDRVGHANNVRYLDWAFLALPQGWGEGREIAGLDLSFRREALSGDCLRSRAYRLDEETVVHEIGPEPRKDAADVCALVSTRWRRSA